jgi:hypothetical protein
MKPMSAGLPLWYETYAYIGRRRKPTVPTWPTPPKQRARPNSKKQNNAKSPSFEGRARYHALTGGEALPHSAERLAIQEEELV